MKLSKKIVSIACAMVMAASLALLAACGGGTTAPASSGEAASGAAEAKVYTIATDTTFAPFEFTDEGGQFVGIDIDILAAIAADQGFEYTVNSVGFDAALQAVTAGQADGVIAGMSITDERKEIFDFSNPYFDSGIVMGISASNTEIKSYDDLSGKSVAVKIGTEGEAFAMSIQDQYGFELVTFKDSAMMYEDVMAGNTAACFEDYPVLGFGIASGNVDLQIVTEMERGSSYGFAVNKGDNPELVQMFNEGLKNIIANGTYQSIIDTYIAGNSSNGGNA